jgi:hypothetical protein
VAFFFRVFLGQHWAQHPGQSAVPTSLPQAHLAWQGHFFAQAHPELQAHFLPQEHLVPQPHLSPQQHEATMTQAFPSAAGM